MSKYIWGDDETQFFFHLMPEMILDAIDAVGFKTTGRCMALNSMENRVYEIEVERPEGEIKTPTDRFVIGKFYRPGRWKKQQILEEHQFLLDLQEAEVPVVAPLVFGGETLFQLPGHELWYTIFPKKGGRIPDEMSVPQLEIMGRLLARMHSVGSIREAKHRLAITPENFGRQNLDFLLKNKVIPPHLQDKYRSLGEQLIQMITPLFQGVPYQRIHGDCHAGNIIWREQEGPFLVDFDDMLVGPPVQDIWMVVPGNDLQAKQNRNILLEAYEEMRSFDYSTLRLIEPLRTLRYIHFSAWIAKRWDDPSFKSHFAHFGKPNYWEHQIQDLQHQIAAIGE